MFLSVAELANYTRAKSDSGPLFIIKILLELGHTFLYFVYDCVCTTTLELSTSAITAGWNSGTTSAELGSCNGDPVALKA